MKIKNYFISADTLLVFFFVFNCAESYVTARQDCITPDGHSGICIPALQCKPMVQYIDDAKPVPPDVVSQLREYLCHQGDTSKICCPSDSIKLTNKVPDPVDVTKHKNLNLLPKDCGLIDIGDKIRNGENALFNEFPWMALLSYNTSNGPSFKCGGTVINDRYILTAAHCVVNVTSPLIGVRVGEYNLGTRIDCSDNTNCLPPFQDLGVEKIIYPEDYNVTLFANDIALIRVSKINLEADNVMPICLPIIEDIRNMEFIKGLVTGWGFTDPFGTTTDILQKVVLEKRDLSVCINAYKVQPAIKLNYKQLCIGGIAKRDSCRGDSGGPFQVATHFNDEDRYVQYGVVSIGPLYCGYDGVPGIYTRVTFYMDWILDHLEP